MKLLFAILFGAALTTGAAYLDYKAGYLSFNPLGFLFPECMEPAFFEIADTMWLVSYSGDTTIMTNVHFEGLKECDK